MNIKKINTTNKDKDLGRLVNFCNWLHKLQTMFASTREQIIKRKNSLKLQKIKKVKADTINLKKRELFKFFFQLFFRIS